MGVRRGQCRAYLSSAHSRPDHCLPPFPSVPKRVHLPLLAALSCAAALPFWTEAELTYLTGKTIWNSTIGFSAALMLPGIPFLLPPVPLALVDVPTMCFLMLAVYTFLLAVRSGGAARMVCSAMAIVLTVLAKYSACFMLTMLIFVMAV